PRKRREISAAKDTARKGAEPLDPPFQNVSRIRTVALLHRAWREAVDFRRRILIEAKGNLSMVREDPRELAVLIGETKSLMLAATEALKPHIEARRRRNDWNRPGERRGRDPLQPEFDAWDEALKKLRGEGRT